MAEQTFLSPNFFEKEIDLTQKSSTQPAGIPGGLIGQSQKGPAYVPVTVADFSDFQSKFGSYNITMPAIYTAELFLKYKSALTFTRVLGAGSNNEISDIQNTQSFGIVKNAGFVISGSNLNAGFVQFISAKHDIVATEAIGYPIFTNNDSITDLDSTHLLRGMLFFTTGSRAILAPSSTSVASALLSEPTLINVEDTFKLIISSSLGSTYGNDEDVAGIKVYSVSLNPESQNYIANVLNSDPTKFVEQQHILYAHFPVESNLATPVSASMLCGSNQLINTINDKAILAKESFGRFDTRYNAPSTPYFISQPFGDKEFNLFKFESLDDGDYASSQYKISVSNLKMSEDETNPYGTFSIIIRYWADNDKDLKVLEQFNNCTLNPTSQNYIGKIVGNYKVYYNHDATSEGEKGLKLSGKFPNRSKYVRIILSDELEKGSVPSKALPFGFLGFNLLKTSSDGTDATQITPLLSGSLSAYNGSIMPPVPYRFKITDDSMNINGTIGKSERTNSNYFWGVKLEKTEHNLNSNISGQENLYIKNITKFLGILKLGSLTNTDESNLLCNNKFTLAKVMLDSYTTISDLENVQNQPSTVMKSAKYIRNAILSNNKISGNITFASLLAEKSPFLFNKYSRYMKFTTILQGGFNGLNILDQNEYSMNDRSVSFSGCAASGYKSPGLTSSPGVQKENNSVMSYLTAAKIMTDRIAVRHNLLAIPGIREEYITDYVSELVKDNYGLCLYLMDIPNYDSSNNIIFDNNKDRPDISTVVSNFNSRNIDNSFSAVYFPDVYIDARISSTDAEIVRRIKLPSSSIALAAMAYSDSASYPWYAPAGFNRGGVNDIVKNTTVRISTDDRNTLYDARINPIAKFPQEGYVIFGQKTLQLKKSSLDRVNVRRLLLELRRSVIEVCKGLLFEQNTPQLRSQFISQVSSQLSFVKAYEGIESFKIIMDDSNNTTDDAQNNRLNGKILIVPTRSIEYIAIDFIVTNSSVQFV